MKDSICDLALMRNVRDEQWRLHAASCSDCRDVLTVSEWMNTLAGRTSLSRALPAAGYLVVKARIQQKHSAASRAAAIPRYAIVFVIGILLTTVAAAAFGGETRFGSVMADALRLLSVHAAELIIALLIVTLVGLAAAYLDRAAKM